VTTKEASVAWFSRFTRFGDMHLVYGQEANMSCGIASVMMCIFKLNKIKPGATALTLEKNIYKRYEAATGGAYSPETTGTYPDKLATILNAFTKGNWRAETTQPESVPQKLIDKTGVIKGLGPAVTVNPVILGVDWDLGGAHWVVVDTVREMFGTTYATICDPWDTNVHIQPFKTGSPFLYDAATGGFTIDFGGSHKGRKQPYTGNAAKGQVKTWGMIFRD
jgi:hypothetical protein